MHRSSCPPLPLLGWLGFLLVWWAGVLPIAEVEGVCLELDGFDVLDLLAFFSGGTTSSPAGESVDGLCRLALLPDDDSPSHVGLRFCPASTPATMLSKNSGCAMAVVSSECRMGSADGSARNATQMKDWSASLRAKKRSGLEEGSRQNTVPCWWSSYAVVSSTEEVLMASEDEGKADTT
ncbi:hypothetical protein C8R44DRAFT_848909 [Mycena epipterygia]|nr:hypothetical protein C8R44DRAFT_848909 [Mycena epipterygia]